MNRPAFALSLLAAVVVLGSSSIAAAPLVPLKEGASILFADTRSRDRFLEYQRFLDADAERYRAEIETIRQLEHSEIQYVIALCEPMGRGVEGCLSSDGERVVITVSDQRGIGGDLASLNSRFAHELEHARQFDAGEFGLARHPDTGEWTSDYYSYDIGDEVKAWEAQLRAATPRDFWRGGETGSRPSTLRQFANATTAKARATVLLQNGYRAVNPTFDRNVTIARKLGFAIGEVVRPSPDLAFFGRVRFLHNVDG